MNLWSAAAAATYAGAAAAIHWRDSVPSALVWLSVAATSLLTARATLAYRTFLMEADELLRRVETGRYDPSLPLAFGIARLFGRTIEEIFEPDGCHSPASES